MSVISSVEDRQTRSARGEASSVKGRTSCGDPKSRRSLVSTSVHRGYTGDPADDVRSSMILTRRAAPVPEIPMAEIWSRVSSGLSLR
jgi:hypothetical protein